MHVVHIITCLDDGGAEAVLYRLCKAAKEHTHVVISLQDSGKYGALLAKEGVSVYCLYMKRELVPVNAFFSLVKILRQQNPDVIQTWMYHADLFGAIAANLAGSIRVFWGIHSTKVDKRKVLTFLIVRLNALLSGWLPFGIVSCSQKGVNAHEGLGYSVDKITVIPNGYDLSMFKPSIEMRMKCRKSLKIPKEMTLIGMVARFDAQKDVPNILAAIAVLKRNNYDFMCLLVGKGMSSNNSSLVDLIVAHDVADRCILLGSRNDIPAIMNALDVHVLSSYAEAFPNVLCESMACGTPCVSTDVGDARFIIGNNGWLVPPRQPEALSYAIIDALVHLKTNSDDWEKRQKAARQHIIDNYSIEKMVERYGAEWQKVLLR